MTSRGACGRGHVFCYSAYRALSRDATANSSRHELYSSCQLSANPGPYPVDTLTCRLADRPISGRPLVEPPLGAADARVMIRVAVRSAHIVSQVLGLRQYHALRRVRGLVKVARQHAWADVKKSGIRAVAGRDVPGTAKQRSPPQTTLLVPWPPRFAVWYLLAIADMEAQRSRRYCTGDQGSAWAACCPCDNARSPCALGATGRDG